MRKHTLQQNKLVSRSYDKFWNWSLFEYAEYGDQDDREIGVSKEEYQISHLVNKIRLNEHLVKHGDI